MNIRDILQEKRDDILRIAQEHGVYNVRVFGSAVRDDAGEESDIDFLVDVGPDHSPFFPGGMLADMEDLLGRKVDIVTENALHWYIKDRVMQEAMPL